MPAFLRLALPVTAATLLLTVSACTPSGAVREEPEEQPEEVDLSQYEDFDPAPYREEAPAADDEEGVEHDVPGRLLSGTADEGVEQTVQGYRVQVLSSKDQSAAEDAATQAQQWWSENAGTAPEGLFSSEDGLPVYTIYRQPYYRVRVGNFTDRAEAERALEFLQQRYGDAFIARSEVTVTR